MLDRKKLLTVYSNGSGSAVTLNDNVKGTIARPVLVDIEIGTKSAVGTGHGRFRSARRGQ